MALQDIDVRVNWLYLVTRILQQIFLDVRVLNKLWHVLPKGNWQKYWKHGTDSQMNPCKLCRTSNQLPFGDQITLLALGLPNTIELSLQNKEAGWSVYSTQVHISQTDAFTANLCCLQLKLILACLPGQCSFFQAAGKKAKQILKQLKQLGWVHLQRSRVCQVQIRPQECFTCLFRVRFISKASIFLVQLV